MSWDSLRNDTDTTLATGETKNPEETWVQSARLARHEYHDEIKETIEKTAAFYITLLTTERPDEFRMVSRETEIQLEDLYNYILFARGQKNIYEEPPSNYYCLISGKGKDLPPEAFCHFCPEDFEELVHRIYRGLHSHGMAAWVDDAAQYRKEYGKPSPELIEKIADFYRERSFEESRRSLQTGENLYPLSSGRDLALWALGKTPPGVDSPQACAPDYKGLLPTDFTEIYVLATLSY